MIEVRSQHSSYEIVFQSIDQVELPSDSVVVTDENVSSIYRDKLTREPKFVMPAGEGSKSLERYQELQEWLLSQGCNRKTTIVAFGGGVVGDLAGFAAATYMRGVDLIQIPTTLLAQVDSSVGGKVGINLPNGKNMIGSFHPPRRVYIDVDFLNTLPQRELHAGMAEVWKYAFAFDENLHASLSSKSIGRQEMIFRCVDIKKSVVQEDEFETGSERARLNAGHTIAHAIEKLSGYGPILHGEAVAIGLVVETALAEHLGICLRGTKDVIQIALESEGLPTTSTYLKDVDGMMAAMRSDKKASAGSLAFSFIEKIGSSRLVKDIDATVVARFLEAI